MRIERIVDCVNKNPKKLFQIDGFGAIISATLLGIILIDLDYLFGIPKTSLYFLATLPCFFAVYDFYCYFKIDKKLGVFLKTIAVGNFVYCSLSIVLAVYHRKEITNLGWIYLWVEILIVFSLAIIELRIAKKHL